MQFKVIVALAFATFAAAYPQASGPARSDKVATTNPGDTTHTGSTNQATTKTTATTIKPPFSNGEAISRSQCPNVDLLCCQTSQSPSDAATALTAVGVDPSNVNGYVGTDCAAIPNGGSCSAKPLCCTKIDGQIGIGCNPVDL